MIGLRATRNYISTRYITQHQIKTYNKKHAYKLALINSSLIKQDEG
jgi:hypothetical protein